MVVGLALALWGISGRVLEFVVPKLTSEQDWMDLELVQSSKLCCGITMKRSRGEGMRRDRLCVEECEMK